MDGWLDIREDMVELEQAQSGEVPRELLQVVVGEVGSPSEINVQLLEILESKQRLNVVEQSGSHLAPIGDMEFQGPEVRALDVSLQTLSISVVW